MFLIKCVVSQQCSMKFSSNLLFNDSYLTMFLLSNFFSNLIVFCFKKIIHYYAHSCKLQTYDYLYRKYRAKLINNCL